MRAQEFYDYMKTKTYIEKGVEKFYTDTAIEGRINHLRNLEDIFNVDLDLKCISCQTGKLFLQEIRNKNIEDLRHTPLSNAFRHYFEFATGVYIGRIF